MTTTHDHARGPAPVPQETAREWLTHDAESARYPSRNPDVVAQLTAPTGVKVQLVNLSRSSENPDIAVICDSPRVSRGRSPAASMLSPLELFHAFETGERTPDVLVRHHRALARRGIFAAAPRALPLPLWAGPNLDLPTDYGDVDLCDGDFGANWNWFSLGHGVVHPYGFFELWTGWSRQADQLVGLGRDPVLRLAPARVPVYSILAWQVLSAVVLLTRPAGRDDG